MRERQKEGGKKKIVSKRGRERFGAVGGGGDGSMR